MQRFAVSNRFVERQGRMNLTSEERKQMEADFKRSLAYHEAGHAAMYWVFGHLLEFVDMRGNRKNAAFVRSRPLWFGRFETVRNMPETVRHANRLGCQRECMVRLAGYAAQSRVDDELRGEVWYLDILLDCEEWEYDEDHDINRAVSAAKGFYGDNGTAWRLLKRMASWTDEAFNHPQLWAGVESLAERLQSVRRRISGGRVFGILNKAWPDAKLPCLNMEKKWRRRFVLPQSQE